MLAQAYAVAEESGELEGELKRMAAEYQLESINRLEILVEWAAQSFIQLVLLPALMVGQNLQNIAADARSAKTFEDVERIIDLLDAHTQGGVKDILEAIDALKSQVVSAGGAGGRGGTGGTATAS